MNTEKMKTDIDALKCNEVLELPKFKASLEKLVNREKFNFILADCHISRNELSSFIDKSVDEGNAILIQKEYNGYCVILWKD